jgi:hypothetical protein
VQILAVFPRNLRALGVLGVLVVSVLKTSPPRHQEHQGHQANWLRPPGCTVEFVADSLMPPERQSHFVSQRQRQWFTLMELVAQIDREVDSIL